MNFPVKPPIDYGKVKVYDKSAPKGLGSWRLARHEFPLNPTPPMAGFEWIHVEPSGREHPTWIYASVTSVDVLHGQMVAEVSSPPPPLPKPRPTTCGCGKPHECMGCGQPHYIEIHGMNDGFCSYCYARG